VIFAIIYVFCALIF